RWPPIPPRSARSGGAVALLDCASRAWAPRWPPIPPALVALRRSRGAPRLRVSCMGPEMAPQTLGGPGGAVTPLDGGVVISMAEWRSAMASPRRFRGVGKGRKTRRALERGGIGPAASLNRALGAWAGVRITPMFGRWGYFAG